MIKTVKIGKKEVLLSNNVGWTMEYDNQFNQDIVQVIMPMLRGLTNVTGGVLEEVEDLDNITMKNVATVLQSESVTEAFIMFSGLKFTEFVQIVWAMAKDADPDIPEPREWVRQFEGFELDVLGPVIFRLVLEGFSSSKNARRLLKTLKDLKGAVKTKQEETKKKEQD